MLNIAIDITMINHMDANLICDAISQLQFVGIWFGTLDFVGYRINVAQANIQLVVIKNGFEENFNFTSFKEFEEFIKYMDN
jgi:hypothetical protein